MIERPMLRVARASLAALILLSACRGGGASSVRPTLADWDDQRVATRCYRDSDCYRQQQFAFLAIQEANKDIPLECAIHFQRDDLETAPDVVFAEAGDADYVEGAGCASIDPAGFADSPLKVLIRPVESRDVYEGCDGSLACLYAQGLVHEALAEYTRTPEATAEVEPCADHFVPEEPGHADFVEAADCMRLVLTAADGRLRLRRRTAQALSGLPLPSERAYLACGRSGAACETEAELAVLALRLGNVAPDDYRACVAESAVVDYSSIARCAGLAEIIDTVAQVMIDDLAPGGSPFVRELRERFAVTSRESLPVRTDPTAIPMSVASPLAEATLFLYAHGLAIEAETRGGAMRSPNRAAFPVYLTQGRAHALAAVCDGCDRVDLALGRQGIRVADTYEFDSQPFAYLPIDTEVVSDGAEVVSVVEFKGCDEAECAWGILLFSAEASTANLSALGPRGVEPGEIRRTIAGMTKEDTNRARQAITKLRASAPSVAERLAAGIEERDRVAAEKAPLERKIKSAVLEYLGVGRTMRGLTARGQGLYAASEFSDRFAELGFKQIPALTSRYRDLFGQSELDRLRDSMIPEVSLAYGDAAALGLTDLFEFRDDPEWQARWHEQRLRGER